MLKEKWFLIISVLLSVIYFGIYFFSGNIEFVAYIAVAMFLVILIEISDRKFNYPFFAKIFFLIWMILHYSGGVFQYNGLVWYKLILLNLIGEPYNILKYDQVLHFFFYLTTSIFLFFILRKFIVKKCPSFIFGLFVFLASIGVGSLNEVMEFIVTVVYPNAGVGGYINNALDLIFNSLGALVGTYFSIKRWDN